MKLRYAANVMPFEDSMKKVSAITWAPSGKKFAVGAADRVFFFLFSLSICLTKMVKERINSLPSLQTKDRKVTSLEDWNFHQILKKLQLLKVTTLFSSIRLD